MSLMKKRSTNLVKGEETIRIHTAYEPIPSNIGIGSSQEAETTNVPTSDKKLIVLIAALCLSFIIPTVVLLTWSLREYRQKNLSFWKSAPIGGSFSQFGAKSIDFVTGAILAPAVMASINLIWFRCIRLVACNEASGQHGAVPLASLLELSTTTGGSYDMIKLWNIIRASRIRFTLAALVVLLSALSTSLFVNVIAYEAFKGSESFNILSNNSLQYCWDPKLIGGDYRSYEKEQFYGLSGEALNDLSGKIFTTLNNVAMGRYINASGSFWSPVNNTFVGVNATSTSLESIDDSVEKLWDVPGYQETVICEPAEMGNISLSDIGSDTMFLEGQVGIDSEREMLSMSLAIPGNSVWLSKYLTLLTFWKTPFLMYEWGAVDQSRTALTLFDTGLPSSNHSTIPTEFGQVPWRKLSREEILPAPNQSEALHVPVYMYGVVCEVHKKHGLVNLTASVGTTRQWLITESSFSDQKENVSSALRQLNTMLNYKAPVGDRDHWLTSFIDPHVLYLVDRGFSPFGQAIGSQAMGNFTEQIQHFPVDFSAYAASLLYATSKIEYILHDVSLSDGNRSIRAPTYPMSGTRRVFKYRMSYIPGLLLLGLVCLATVSAIIIGVMVSSWNLTSFKTHRTVDGLRFLADFASTTNQKHVSIPGAHEWDRYRLEKWSDSVRLRYTADSLMGTVRLEMESSYDERENLDPNYSSQYQ